MSLILIGVLGVVVLLGVFVSPWLGGALLLAAGVAVLFVLVTGAARAAEPDGAQDEGVEAPHLPGPGNPRA